MSSAITVTVAQAAKDLGAPKAAVERIAAELGLLICFGNRKRIDPNDYQEIIDACRNKRKDPAFTAEKKPVSGSSATPGAGSVQQALATAEKLKQFSRNTSLKRTARAARPHQME